MEHWVHDFKANSPQRNEQLRLQKQPRSIPYWVDDDADDDNALFQHEHERHVRSAEENLGHSKWKMQMYFVARAEKNILKEEHVKMIRDTLQDFMHLPLFQALCSSCKAPSGPLSNIVQGDTMHVAAEEIFVRGWYDYVESSFTAKNPKSWWIRAEFSFKASKKEYLHFIEAVHNHLESYHTDEVYVVHGGDVLTEWEIEHTIYSDSSFALLSLIVVGVIMLWRFHSPLLATAGLVSIVLSFPMVYFIYRVILDIEFVGVLNAMSLFLILGIGVDDLFVIFSMYAHSRDIFSDMEQRLAFTYRRATKATFITSLTTAAAFGVNILSAVPSFLLSGSTNQQLDSCAESLWNFYDSDGNDELYVGNVMVPSVIGDLGNEVDSRSYLLLVEIC